MRWKGMLSICKWVGLGVAVLAILAGLLFGLAQTDLGKSCLASWIGRALSRGAGVEVRLERLDGFIPSDLRLQRLQVSDPDGEWLEVVDLVLRWSPASLLRGRIHIRELSAGLLRLERLPKARASDRVESVSLPSWPRGFPGLMLERLVLERVILGKPILGSAGVFTVQGEMRTVDAAGIDGSLHVERVDGPKARAALSWTLRGEEPELSLALNVEEGEDGFLASKLGLKGMGPVVLNLRGEGPLRDWNGDFSMGFGGSGRLEAAIGLSLNQRLRVTTSGSLQIPPILVPEKLASLRGLTGGSFSLDLSYQGGRELVVRRAQVHNGFADLGFSGRIDIQRQHLDGEFALRIEDLLPLGSLIGTALEGQLSLRGDVRGPVRQPEMNVQIALGDGGVAGLRARVLACEFQLALLGPVRRSFPGLSVKGRGTVEGLVYPTGFVLPETGLTWSLAGVVPARGAFSIEYFDLKGEVLRLRIAGQLDPRDPSFRGDAHLEVQDLSRLSGLLPDRVSGEVSLSTSLEGSWQERSLLARVDGRAGGLRPLPSFLSALVGSELSYGGQVTFDASKLMITGLRVNSPDATLTGDGRVDLRTRDLAVRCRIRVPSLGILSREVGHPIEGSLDMDIGIAGTLDAPMVTAEVTGRELSIKDFGFNRVEATIRAEELLKKPRGDFDIRLYEDQDRLSATGDFVLDGGGRLLLSKLELALPDTKVTGTLALDLRQKVIEGPLEGRSSDLTFFSGYLGEGISGSASFEAQLSAGREGQEIDLKLQGRDLVSRFGQCDEATFSARLSDAFRRPRGTGELWVSGFQTEALRIETGRLRVSGTSQNLEFSGIVSGRYKEPFEIRGSGSFESSIEGRQLLFDRMEGRFGGYDLALGRPAIFNRSRDGYTLEGVALRFGSGGVQARARILAASLDLEAAFEGLPLRLLGLVGAPDIIGTGSGHIRLQGRSDQPEGTFALRCTGIRLQGEAYEGLPPATVVVDGELRKGTGRAVVSLAGLTESPVEGTIQCPLIFSLAPLTVSLPPEGDLEGRIAATINLSNLLPLFSLESQNLDGWATINLTLSGTISSPEVTGFCRIEKGAYENTRTGTILKDVNVEVVSKDRRLVIRDGRATDGEKGVVSVTGWLDVDPSKGYPLELEIHLEDATLLRQDSLTATLAGDLNLIGPFRELALVGDVVVERTEVRIPERLSAEIPDIEVIEVNRPADQPVSTPSAPRSRTRQSPRLDVRVEFPGRAFLRGRGLDSEWRGALRIEGPSHEAAITGLLSLVRGHFNLFGKRFALTEGAIRFDGAVPPNPNFDVAAESERADITARIRVSGTPSALSVTLESDPPLPSDEILSHVLFNRDVASITPVQALRLTAALNTLAGGGFGTFDFMEQTRRLVGLDQIDIKPSEEDLSESSIVMGKYLNQGIYVEVEKGMATHSGKASVEFEVTPNVTVETEAGTDAQGGIGLNWRWNY